MSNDSGILSRLDERSAWTLDWLARIDRRLESGDERMDEMTARIAALETRRPADPMPAIERAIKIALPYIIFGLTLAGTGSLDSALRVVGGLAK